MKKIIFIMLLFVGTLFVSCTSSYCPAYADADVEETNEKG